MCMCYKIQCTTIFVMLQEFADALREFTPNEEGAKDAEQTASDLEEMKRKLEQHRKDQEERMRKEQEGKNS